MSYPRQRGPLKLKCANRLTLNIGDYIRPDMNGHLSGQIVFLHLTIEIEQRLYGVCDEHKAPRATGRHTPQIVFVL